MGLLAALAVAGTSGLVSAGPASATDLLFGDMSLAPGQMMTQYAGAASTDNAVSLSVSADKVPTGGGVYVSVVGRTVPGAGQYVAKVRLLPDRSVGLSLGRVNASSQETALVTEKVVPGVQVGAGEQVNVRYRASGAVPTTLQAKAWKAGSVEPSAWLETGSDATPGLQSAGAVGVKGYLSGSATNAPVRLHYANVQVNPSVQPPAPRAPRGSGSAGSVPVGAAQYAVPVGAVFVSPSGDDAGSGSVGSPWRTVGRAIGAAPNGATVVLRGGSYHESVTIPSGRALTVQSYPGEAVWFDGSSRVSSWVADGSGWRADGWTARFDHSPTYTPGAPDNTTPGWSFVNAAHPMAAYPDMVFLDGVAQTQVGSRSQVVPETFFVDTAASKLYLGSDPTGHEVRASDLGIGITVRGAGSVLRGFGVRRYATAVPQKGALLSVAPNVTLENVTISDNATQGMYVGGMYQGTNNVLRHVTAERNGLLGIESSYADGLKLLGVRASGNNTEHFNQAPVSGGAKLSRERNITITGSVFAGNEGPGLWMDESDYNAVVTGNDMVANAGHGISFEISSNGVFVDNLIAGNGGTGMKMNDASNLTIWNNTFVDNHNQPLWIVQDSRVASNLSTPGHDPRQSLPDPTVTWLLGPASVKNNVFARTSSNCFLCVQDNALHRNAATIGVQADGNVYNRPTSTSPSWLVTWANGGSNPQVYSTVDAFRSATGQEPHGTDVTGASIVDSSYKPTATLLSLEPTTAQPLDSTAAGLSGHTPGELHLGAWLN